MEVSCYQTESPVFTTESPVFQTEQPPSPPPPIRKKSKKSRTHQDHWPRKNTTGVTLEGFVDAIDGVDGGSEGGCAMGRAKSLTDEDLEELKGCLDLGFGFSYEEIPELCNTLPALELCYSMTQRFLDEQQRSPEASEIASSNSPLVANWKISSPGDHPDEVKARLRYWAQAVACTVRLCS